MRRIVDWSVGDCEWIHYICTRVHVEIAQAKENTAAKKKGRVPALIIKFLSYISAPPLGIRLWG